MRAYLDAFAWPFRPPNLPSLLFFAAVAVLVPGTLGLFPSVLLWGGWPLFLALAGVYAVFLRDILQNAMAGRDCPPGRPAEELFELVHELFSVLGPILAAFAPLAALRITCGAWPLDLWEPLPPLTELIGGPIAPDFFRGSPLFRTPSVVCWFLAWVALPILIVAWPFGGPRSILHPIALIRAASRAGLEYLLTAVLTAGLFIGSWAAMRISVPKGLEALTSYRAYGVAFFALVVAARVVGTFYYRNREALGLERIPATRAETPVAEPAPQDADAVS
jgi:hypothetical protein